MKIQQISTFIAAAGLSFAMSSAIAQPPAQGQAQAQGQAAPQAQGQQQRMEFDDSTLDQFADALNGISDIRTEYSAQIGETQDPQEAQELQQEAQTKMVEAVEESGLDVQTYNMIAQQMQADPELQEKVQERM